MGDFPGGKIRKVFKDIDQVKREYAVFEREEFEKLEARKWYDFFEWIDQIRLVCSRTEKVEHAKKMLSLADQLVANARRRLRQKKGKALADAKEHLQFARQRHRLDAENLRRAPQEELERVLQEAYAKAKVRRRGRELDYATLLRARGPDLLVFWVMKHPHLKDPLLRGERVERPGTMPAVTILRSTTDAQAAPPQGQGAPPAPQKTDCSYTKDFSTVWWYGEEHHFNETEAACIRALWAAWEGNTKPTDKPALHQKTIRTQIKSENSDFRLIHVFRHGKKMNPAWGRMIHRLRPGTFYLSRPTNSSPARRQPRRGKKDMPSSRKRKKARSG